MAGFGFLGMKPAFLLTGFGEFYRMVLPLEGRRLT